MRRHRIIAMMAAALLCGFGISAHAKSYKRGVGENNFLLMNEIYPIAPGVSWFYNWGNDIKGYRNEITDYLAENPILEYCPMCWNGNYDTEKIRTWCQNHPETKFLLGFNEPNFTDQANMTPAEAAEKWPAVQALAKELGLELVGPAVNYAPSGAYTDPFKWYAEFVDLVGVDAFDYVAVHDYAGGTANMKDLVDRFYALYGKQIWITEFCNWSGTVSNDSQISSMIQQLEYLEKEDKVFRYAWFKAKAANLNDNPHYSLLIPLNGTGLRELTQQGYVYTYMTDFDETVFHPADTWVPAGEFIHSYGLRLNKTADEASGGVLEISQFNSGAYVDYQFSVPASGEYTLVARVSGQGEPVRFDPSIALYGVEDDETDGPLLCASQSFTLSGDDATYTEVTFALSLQEGQQRIRLKDANPYSPSGIHISALKLVEGNVADGILHVASDRGTLKACVCDDGIRFSGVEGLQSATVYDLNGRAVGSGSLQDNKLATNHLPVGMYVVRVQSADGTVYSTKVIKP